MEAPRDERLLTWPFVLLCASCFVFSLSLYTLAATLPLYIRAIGIRESLIGVIIGLFSLTSMVTKPWSGWASDRYGRLPILWAGGVIALSASLLYLVSRSTGSLSLLRILHGIGIGCYPTAATAMAGDLAPPARRGEAMGYFGAAWALAIAVGPLMGIALIRTTGFESLFWTAGGLGALALALSIPFKETRPHGLRIMPFTLASALTPRAFYPASVVICLYVNYGILFTFLPLFVEERGLGNPGLFFTFYALVVTAVRGFAGRLSDRVGRVPMAMLGMGLAAAAMAALGLSQSFTAVLLAGLLYGLGFSAAQPSLTAWTMDRVPPEEWGKALGTFYMALELGIGTGSIVFGFLLARTGYPAVFLAGAVVALGGALLCLPAR